MSGSPPAGLQLSEAVASAEGDLPFAGGDWIELFNAGSAPVSLADYSLRDSASEAAPLPDMVLQPGEYALVLADDAALDAALAVPFKLGKADSVTLSRNGQDLMSLSWEEGANGDGESYGIVQGTPATLYPTPGYANVPNILFSDSAVFTLRVDIAPEQWQALLADPAAEAWHPANMELNGARIDNVGFRTKGQSSLSMVAQIPETDPSAKRFGFKIDFNRYVEQKFMGMKTLVLSNSFADPSMMRDIIAYRLFKAAGMPAPETSFVDLWVAGEHLGLYQLVEAVDGEFVEKYFPDDREADVKGDLYKAEVFTTLAWAGDSPADYPTLELKTNEETIGTPEEGAALMRFIDSINNGPDRLAHVDVDHMVRYMAAAVLTGNLDSYWSFTANNFYLYEHRSQDSFTLLPWDFNLSLGVYDSAAGGGGGGFNPGGSCSAVEHLIENPVAVNQTERPLLDALLQNPDFMAAYKAQLQILVDTAFDPAQQAAEIERLAAMIDPFVAADPTKFFTYDEWRRSLTEDMPRDSSIEGGRGGGFFGPAAGLTKFITARVENVRRQLSGEIPANNNGNNACPENLAGSAP